MSVSDLSVETQLRAHAPRAPEPLRVRVLALEPRRMPSRRLAVVVAVAIAVAIAAAIVHGLVSSAPAPKSVVMGEPPRAAFAPSAGGSGGGAVRAHIPSVAGTRLQQTEATLDLEVKDVSAATTAATRIATSLGGYAQSVTYSSSSRTSSLLLRVPVQNVKTALARLGALGAIVSQNLSVTDLQHDLQVETAQIAELRHTIAALQAALRNPSLSDAQRVILQIRLANAKRSLSQRLHARTGTIAAGTNASISLTLSTKRSAVAPPHHRGRLGRMVHSAVGFLGLEGTVALYALIVVSPLAVAAALAWSLREARRRRDERLVME
jgi:Domain of unknown function (DUF4349)